MPRRRARLNYMARSEEKTALVLSGGGMFGAYQAGVWASLADSIRFDMVVGVSIGSLNGWLIAGGCSAASLQEQWLDLGAVSRVEWRYPERLSEGIIDPTVAGSWIRRIFESSTPKVRYALVVTRMRTM